MNTSNNIEIGEWSIKQFENQIVGELCLGYELGNNYHLVKAIYVIWG